MNFLYTVFIHCRSKYEGVQLHCVMSIFFLFTFYAGGRIQHLKTMQPYGFLKCFYFDQKTAFFRLFFHLFSYFLCSSLSVLGVWLGIKFGEPVNSGTGSLSWNHKCSYSFHTLINIIVQSCQYLHCILHHNRFILNSTVEHFSEFRDMGIACIWKSDSKFI